MFAIKNGEMIDKLNLNSFHNNFLKFKECLENWYEGSGLAKFNTSITSVCVNTTLFRKCFLKSDRIGQTPVKWNVSSF